MRSEASSPFGLLRSQFRLDDATHNDRLVTVLSHQFGEVRNSDTVWLKA